MPDNGVPKLELGNEGMLGVIRMGEPSKIISSERLLELILSTIGAYLRLLEKKKWGALSDFARENKIPNYMLTRLKNRMPKDGYEPKASAILTLIKAILSDPLMELALEEATAETLKSDFPDMEQNIITIFKTAVILCNKDLLDKDFYDLFLMMVTTLHSKTLLLSE